jgi:hypothetical protein
MTHFVKRTIITAAAVMAIAPVASAAAAPVEVTAFSLSPTCTHPGGTVTANTTVQNTTLLPQQFYAQTRTTYYGYPVQTSSVYGPYAVPSLSSLSKSTPTTIPSNAPWGNYTVVFGIGPSASSAMSWSTRSAPLKVAPAPFC